MTTIPSLIASARSTGCTHAAMPVEEVERLLAENERLTKALRACATEDCWAACGEGVVKDDHWSDGARSRAEWLAAHLGFPEDQYWHPIEEVKARIPDLVERIVRGEVQP